MDVEVRVHFSWIAWCINQQLPQLAPLWFLGSNTHWRCPNISGPHMLHLC